MTDLENEEVERITHNYLTKTSEFIKDYKSNEMLYRSDTMQRDLFAYPLHDFADCMKDFKNHVRLDCAEHIVLSTCLEVLNAIYNDLMGCLIPNIEPCEVKT